MRFVVFLLLALLPLSACGKKPNFVDPPLSDSAASVPASDSADAKPQPAARPVDNYPRLYPKPWL